VQQQACIRPLSPDGFPIIGQHPYVAGAYIATGVKNMHDTQHLVHVLLCNLPFIILF